MTDWGHDEGELPSRIWCFVDLTCMDTGAPNIDFGGVVLDNEIYAVVEVAEVMEEDDNLVESDLFIPLDLIMEGLDPEGNVIGRKFFLADVDAIAGPCCVIPDLGSDPGE